MADLPAKAIVADRKLKELYYIIQLLLLAKEALCTS
jgi:hypothetical protein